MRLTMEEMEYQQSLQDEEPRELAEKYDSYGGWCGVFCFFFP